MKLACLLATNDTTECVPVCYYTYQGVQGGVEGSVGGAAWETWWSGSDSSCCLYGNYRENERDTIKHDIFITYHCK